MIMKRWRIGSLSMGLVLVASGVVMLVSLIVQVNVLNVMLTFWPVILICLGVEILLHLFVRKTDDTERKLRYDVLSVFFISFLLIISIGFYTVVYYASLFESRDDMFTSFGMMNESVSIEGGETLAGTKELVVFNGLNRITVLSAPDGVLRVEYTASANTNDIEYARFILNRVVRLEQGERAYLLPNTTADRNSRKMSWPMINCIIHLPLDTELDLSNFWGALEYDNAIQGQIIRNK